MDYTNVGEISALLNENGLSMTKKFGQNFLISENALQKITDISGVTEGTKVWEIGPGLGALTSHMLAKGAQVTAFEIDHGFCRLLREVIFKDNENFTLVEGDALKTWKDVFKQTGCPDLICANLPYNVGSVLIASFIENRMLPPKMVFTLQSEVVQRICANVGDDQYSGFSLLMNVDYQNREALKIKRSCFWPSPNVDSSVVEMTRRAQSRIPEQWAPKFFTTTRALFSQRRKTVRNNLKALASAERIDNALAKSNISETERAEKLSIEEILVLTQNLFDNP